MAVTRFIDQLTADQERRHAWLIRAGEQARQFNSEIHREAGCANNAPAAD